MNTKAVINWIEQEMSGENVSEVLLAVLKGWGRINPEDELIWLSLPRADPEQRRQILKRMIEMIER